MEKRFDEIMESATTLMNIEKSHMARYGNAEYIPFWREKKQRLTIDKKMNKIFLKEIVPNKIYYYRGLNNFAFWNYKAKKITKVT